jgi:hypothetical protein
MTHIIDLEPSCHGEASGEQVWQDAMTEEYQSILKNIYGILFQDQRESL